MKEKTSVYEGKRMRLHHVGVVVEAIETHSQHYRELGLRPLTDVVTDPIQKVKVQFWGNDGPASSVELIEPLGEESPVRGFLEKGGGLNHLCFEVADLEAARKNAEVKGGICVCAPVPAAAFGGRRITFFFFRGVGLIEFVEAPTG